MEVGSAQAAAAAAGVGPQTGTCAVLSDGQTGGPGTQRVREEGGCRGWARKVASSLHLLHRRQHRQRFPCCSVTRLSTDSRAKSFASSRHCSLSGPRGRFAYKNEELSVNECARE